MGDSKMGAATWVRRFAYVFAVAFAVIVASHLVRDRVLVYAVGQGLLWSGIAATVFTVVRYYHWRRGRECALCGDLPEGEAPKQKEPR